MNEKKPDPLAEAKQIAANTFKFLQKSLGVPSETPPLAVGLNLKLSMDTYSIEVLVCAVAVMHGSGLLNPSEKACLASVLGQLNRQVPPEVKRRVIAAAEQARRQYHQRRARGLFHAAMAAPSMN